MTNVNVVVKRLMRYVIFILKESTVRKVLFMGRTNLFTVQ